MLVSQLFSKVPAVGFVKWSRGKYFKYIKKQLIPVQTVSVLKDNTCK